MSQTATEKTYAMGVIRIASSYDDVFYEHGQNGAYAYPSIYVLTNELRWVLVDKFDGLTPPTKEEAKGLILLDSISDDISGLTLYTGTDDSMNYVLELEHASNDGIGDKTHLGFSFITDIFASTVIEHMATMVYQNDESRYTLTKGMWLDPNDDMGGMPFEITNGFKPVDGEEVNVDRFFNGVCRKDSHWEQWQVTHPYGLLTDYFRSEAFINFYSWQQLNGYRDSVAEHFVKLLPKPDWAQNPDKPGGISNKPEYAETSFTFGDDGKKVSQGDTLDLSKSREFDKVGDIDISVKTDDDGFTYLAIPKGAYKFRVHATINDNTTGKVAVGLFRSVGLMNNVDYPLAKKAAVVDGPAGQISDMVEVYYESSFDFPLYIRVVQSYDGDDYDGGVLKGITFNPAAQDDMRHPNSYITIERVLI